MTWVASVATMMIDHNIGSVVVVDGEGNICGLVTERMFMPQEDFFPFMRGTVTTSDGNKRWQRTFDGVLRRHRPSPFQSAFTK